MTRRPVWSGVAVACCCCVAFLARPGLAGAQTLSGITEWTVAGGSNTSGGQTTVSRSFWQNYAINFGSFVLDPRFLKYDAGLTFGTTARSFGSSQGDRHGGQRGLGYRFSASMFPARPFPLSVQLSRNNVSQSGDLQTASPIRGGIALPAGQPAPDFETRNNSLAVNWQLKVGALPHVDVGYRKSDAETTGGGYAANERNGEFHAIVSKDTASTRQTLRYQKTSSEHFFTQSFNQRFNELDYDFGLQLTGRSRLTARAGKRSWFSLFEMPGQVVDSGTGLALPDAQGQNDTVYATSGITFEPGPRLSFGLSGSLDEQQAVDIKTTSRLLTTTARLEPFDGFSVSASGNYGTRGQVVADVPVNVVTKTAQVGASYRAGYRWLEGSVAGSRGVGENSTVDGRVGRVESWSGEASLYVSIRAINLNAGYDRRNGNDALLDFGNFDVRRRRASIQWLRQRIAVSGQWDRSQIDRGRALTFSRGRQNSYSALASFRWRETQLGASGGGFDSRTTFGHDHTYFASLNAESRVRRVRLSAALREELTSASATQLDQNSFIWFLKAEYTRRLFGFAIEYRVNSHRLQYDRLLDPTTFRGRQFNVRILRKFGARL